MNIGLQSSIIKSELYTVVYLKKSPILAEN